MAEMDGASNAASAGKLDSTEGKQKPGRSSDQRSTNLGFTDGPLESLEETVRSGSEPRTTWLGLDLMASTSPPSAADVKAPQIPVHERAEHSIAPP